MAKSYGPITEGIKDSIKASGKTPYAIANEVRQRTKDRIKLSPAQLYKFLAGDVGLSLAVLDEIAVVLDLVVRGRDAAPEASASIAPILEQAVHQDPDGARGERPTGRAASSSGTRSLQDRVEEPSHDNQTPRRLMSLKERIALMKAEMGPMEDEEDDDEDPFADDDKGMTGGPPPPRPPAPDFKPGDDYEPVDSSDLVQRQGMPTINAREYPERNKYLASKLDMNPGMKKLAEKYSKTAGSNGYEKAKFYHFVMQMMHFNPHAKAILSRTDLADRYRDLAERVPNPIHMGDLGNVITPGDLYPASENPEGFYANIHFLLKRQGVSNGVVKPRKGPKPPGVC